MPIAMGITGNRAKIIATASNMRIAAKNKEQEMRLAWFRNPLKPLNTAIIIRNGRVRIKEIRRNIL